MCVPKDSIMTGYYLKMFPTFIKKLTMSTTH